MDCQAQGISAAMIRDSVWGQSGRKAESISSPSGTRPVLAAQLQVPKTLARHYCEVCGRATPPLAADRFACRPYEDAFLASESHGRQRGRRWRTERADSSLMLDVAGGHHRRWAFPMAKSA